VERRRPPGQTERKLLPARLLSEHVPAGYHEVDWDASMFASGVYFYRMQQGKEIRSRKLVLLR